MTVCAQIVPDKVKFFQTVPNETKNTMKNWYRINFLKSQHFRIFKNLAWKSPCRQLVRLRRIRSPEAIKILSLGTI